MNNYLVKQCFYTLVSMAILFWELLFSLYGLLLRPVNFPKMPLCNPDFKIRIHVCYFRFYNPDNSNVQSAIRLSHTSAVLSFAFKNNKKN